MISTKKFTTAFTLIILVLKLQVIAKEKFELTFLNFTCSNSAAEESKPLITAYHCGLNKNIKRRSLNFEIVFKKNVMNFDLNIIIILPRRTNDFVLLNITKLNGCNMLSNKNQVPLLQLSRKILDHYSNLPKKCPLYANISSYIRGFRLDIDLLPAFAFETDIIAKFEYVIDRKLAFKGLIHSHVGPKGNL